MDQDVVREEKKGLRGRPRGNMKNLLAAMRNGFWPNKAQAQDKRSPSYTNLIHQPRYGLVSRSSRKQYCLHLLYGLTLRANPRVIRSKHDQWLARRPLSRDQLEAPSGCKTGPAWKGRSWNMHYNCMQAWRSELTCTVAGIGGCVAGSCWVFVANANTKLRP